MGRNAIMDAIRNLFGSIDGIIYSLIGTAYNLLVEIAHFRIFDNETLEEFAARIYAILGIFMLFKLSFSFINYMINPDAFTDKEKGVQNLIKNIIIMFAMLIMCPWAFRQLWGLQAAILDDNIIPRFIFGSVSATASSDKYSDECSDGDVIDNSTDQIGNYMATMVLRGFYQPYNNADLEGTEEYENAVILLCDASTKNISYMLSDSIYNAYADLEWGWGGEAYIMEYKYVMSTIVGGFILLILVTFCLDVGARMVKLSFLQLIAPIPIISYIDPASGKNGIFKKWLKEVGSTWVSIFIKLIALFFAVAVIQHIGKLIPVDEASKDTASIWVQIFVILGALMFAKSLPKLLGDIFGIKMDGGSFSINPLKKIEKDAIGGKQITGFAKAAPAAGLAGAAAFGTNLIATKGNVFRAAAGAFSATGRGLKGAVKGEKFGKNFSNSYRGAMQARVNKADRKAMGIRAVDVAKENMKASMFIQNDAQKNKMELDHFKEFSSAGEAAKKRAEGEVDKKASMIDVDGQNLGALRDAYEILKNTQIQRQTGESDASYKERVDAHAKLAAKANSDYFKARKKVVNAYVENAENLNQATVTNGGSNITGFDGAFGSTPVDIIVTSNIQKMNDMNIEYKMGQTVDKSDIGKTIQDAANKVSSIEGSKEYRQAELISQQAKKEKNSK